MAKTRKPNGLVILAVIGRNLPFLLFLLFSFVAVANRDGRNDIPGACARAWGVSVGVIPYCTVVEVPRLVSTHVETLGDGDINDQCLGDYYSALLCIVFFFFFFFFFWYSVYG